METTELPKWPPLLYKRGAVLKNEKRSHSNLTILSDLAKRINLKNQHGTKMKGPSHPSGSAQCVTMRLFHKTTGGWYGPVGGI